MNIKYIACFLSGGAVGSAVTYFLTRKQNEKKVEEAVDEVVAAAGRYDEACKELQSLQERYDVLLHRTYGQHDDDPVDPVDFEADLEPVETPEEEPYAEMDVYAIGIQDFMQDPKYEKKYLTYYRADRTMLTESEEVVEDIPKRIGDMADLLYAYTGEVMYIRNTRTNTDYQIDFDDGAAAEVIGSDP